MKKYILEFIAICDYFKKNQTKQKRGCFVVDRTQLEAMLNQNKFATAKDKLHTWKRLNWIMTDEERLTKRISQDGKYVAMIFICQGVYHELKRITELGGEKDGKSKIS